MIFAQSHGHNAWLWIPKDVNVEQKNEMMRKLIDHLKGHTLSGVSGEPQTAENFAEEYSKSNDLQYRTYMKMESYCCPIIKKPLNC